MSWLSLIRMGRMAYARTCVCALNHAVGGQTRRFAPTPGSASLQRRMAYANEAQAG